MGGCVYGLDGGSSFARYWLWPIQNQGRVPKNNQLRLQKGFQQSFAKTANDRNCAFLTTNKKERFAVIWQNNKLKSNFKYSDHLTTGHSKTEQVLVSSIFCFSLKYFVYVFYVHLKNDVFSISLPFPLFQGNTLSLPNFDSSLVNFVTAYKRLWYLCVSAGTSD